MNENRILILQKNQAKKKRRIFSFLIIIITLSIITMGCVSDVSGQIYQQLNKNTIAQASSSIQNFTDNSALVLKYQSTDHQIYADIYEFSSDTGKFYVNSVTGRVQNAQFISPTPPSIKEIDLNQAYFFAEAYAKQKYPTLWETSDQRGINNTVKKLTNHGDDSNYDFAWSDEYYTADSNSNHYVITGPNNAHVTLLLTGAVQAYDERVVSLDPSLDLTPSLPESRAWEIAANYFGSQGVKDIIKSADANQGLHIVTDKKNLQHLTWQFTASNRGGYGGQINVDAHDGAIVTYLPWW